MAVTSSVQDLERIDWTDPLEWMDWRQGEHITLIGPTGRGKTELTIELLKDIRSVVFFGTKRIDSTQVRLRSMGYRTIADSAEINPDLARKFILRPPFPNVSAGRLKELHRDVFREGIMTAYRQTGWCLAVDEARYICDNLGLRDEMALVWLQGRSQGNTVIANTQRPRYVPLEAYDQATHIFMWTDRDGATVKRNAEILGLNYRDVRDIFRSMSKHDVLYVNTVTDEMYVTNTRWG